MFSFNRRAFLRRTGLAATVPLGVGATGKPSATIVLDGNDPIASTYPVLKAAHALHQALTEAGYSVRRAQSQQQADGLCIVVAGNAGAGPALRAAHLEPPPSPESFTIFQAGESLVACGGDMRGLIYAVHELADRVRLGVPLTFPAALQETPANAVRSVMRQFTSEVYDKPWFYDRAQWPQYFAMLVANRFNRVNVTLGLGYDMLTKVADPYLVFAYPFLLAVPGYDVRVTGLDDAERDRNLATLRFISEQAVAHGLQFELGLWMHGYVLKDTPDAKYVVTGLTPDNHAAYCRDAVTALLKALPAVSSVGLRIHGESGIAEGSYAFWKEVFGGVVACGRKVELDLHAKGIDKPLLASALATGLPVNVSPKFSAEHLGLPYHPADIRPSEIPALGATGKGLMALSEGQRSFTRYGNADLLREDRPYSLRTRVFYGSQRILASGGAEFAAAYSRAFQFCGMTGFDLMEPLTFRGRRGSAIPGTRRSGYLPEKLEPRYDWQKYAYWYRSFGRMGFNPEADPQSVTRSFGTKPQARALEAALAAASRILPLVTQISSVSAACDLYWPEVDGSMPLAREMPASPYFDTPTPRNFQNVTPLDPQLFLSCSHYAEELLGERSGKYAPTEVASWLHQAANDAEAHLKTAGQPDSVEAMRLATDIAILAGLGHYYADKLSAGVLFALYERSGELPPLEECRRYYRSAREHWAKLVTVAHGIYAADLSISDRSSEHGQWSDRLAEIDADIAALDKLDKTASVTVQTMAAVSYVLRSPERTPLGVTHTAPTQFTPGQEIVLSVGTREKLATATLWYRRVNAAERWLRAEMTATVEGWRGAVPAAYTDTAYPLQYYFEFRAAPYKAWLAPGFNATQSNQPYVVVRPG